MAFTKDWAAADNAACKAGTKWEAPEARAPHRWEGGRVSPRSAATANNLGALAAACLAPGGRLHQRAAGRGEKASTEQVKGLPQASPLAWQSQAQGPGSQPAREWGGGVGTQWRGRSYAFSPSCADLGGWAPVPPPDQRSVLCPPVPGHPLPFRPLEALPR